MRGVENVPIILAKLHLHQYDIPTEEYQAQLQYRLKENLFDIYSNFSVRFSV